MIRLSDRNVVMVRQNWAIEILYKSLVCHNTGFWNKKRKSLQKGKVKVYLLSRKAKVYLKFRSKS